jgi:hypothetical protein
MALADPYHATMDRWMQLQLVVAMYIIWVTPVRVVRDMTAGALGMLAEAWLLQKIHQLPPTCNRTCCNAPAGL